MTHLTRRAALTGLVTIALTTTLPKISSAAAPIKLTAARNDENDFFRAPVLLTGQQDAILIDGSFNYGAGAALVEQIKATGKRLTTIYISVNDPDYYFSLKPVKEAFPEARVIAASETIAQINKNVQGKIDVWAPVLGEFGPQSLDEIVFAEAFDEAALTLEGTRIDIVTSKVMHDRRYLWVPSIKAVIGGVYAFDGLHVWTAESPTPEGRGHWVAELDALIERAPEVVVAGHAAEGVNNGIESLNFTRDYLLAYEVELGKAKDSATLIAAMTQAYPNLGLGKALEIGAKVATGEMTWG